MRRFIHLLLLSILCWRCDPGDFDLPEWETALFLPVINADFDISDITLTVDEVIEIDSSGQVIFVYKDTDQTPSFEEIFPFEDQNFPFSLPGIPGDVQDFGFDLSVDADRLEVPTGNFIQLEPFKLNTHDISIDASDFFTEVEFEKGSLTVTITNRFPFVINPGLGLSITSNFEGAAFLSHITDVSISPNETYSLPAINLTDRLIEGSQTLTISGLTSPGGTDLEIKAVDDLLFEFQYEEPTFRNAVLNLDRFQLTLPEFSIPLDLGDLRIQNLAVESGRMELEFTDLSQTLFQTGLKFESITTGGQPLEISIGPEPVNQDLTGSLLNLALSDPPYNYLTVQTTLEVVDPTAAIIFFNQPTQGELTLNSIDYGLINGYLGIYEETLEGAIEVDLFEEIVSGEIVFETPLVVLETQNEFGLPAVILEGFNISGSNPRLRGEKEIEIGQSLIGLRFEAASGPNAPSITSFTVDQSSEPDFSEFIALPPSRIAYNIPIRVGTDEIDLNQFLNGSDNIVSSVSIELPLSLKADDLVIRDTLSLSTELGYRSTDAVFGNLKATSTNYFPLQLLFQSYFLDSTNTVVDSLFRQRRIVESAQVEADGLVSNPFVAEFDIEINKEKVERIRRSSKIVPVFLFITPGDDFVKILSSYKINFKMIGDVTVNVSSQL